MTIPRVNRCQFCGKTFSRKRWFHRHTCVKKRKFEETNDVVTRHAFRVYVYWMQKLKMVTRGKKPDIDKFLKSPMKDKFVTLILHCREHGITSAYSYIDWLVATRIQERNWFDDNRLAEYKIYSETHEDPEDQAIVTVNAINRWIIEDPESRTPDEFVDKLTPGTILSNIRRGVLTPWVAFGYEPIAEKWLSDDGYNAETYYRIDDIVNCNYWIDKLLAAPEGVDIVQETMSQLWESQT